MQKQKINYSELTTGYEFPQTSFYIDETFIVSYLKAVEDSTGFYQGTNLVPQMALVTLAMAELSKNISLPEGAIHVSQELEFASTVSLKDTITSHAQVSRKQKSGRFDLLTIDLHLRNQNNIEVISGQTEFILPFLNDINGK